LRKYFFCGTATSTVTVTVANANGQETPNGKRFYSARRLVANRSREFVFP